MSGFEQRPERAESVRTRRDRREIRGVLCRARCARRTGRRSEAACVGPIAYVGQAALQRDIDNLKAALAKVNVTEAFLPVAAAPP